MCVAVDQTRDDRLTSQIVDGEFSGDGVNIITMKAVFVNYLI